MMHPVRTLLSATLLACFTTLPAYASESAHWGYAGDGSPEHWGEVDTHFAECQLGHNQSPINIRRSEHTRHTPLVLKVGSGEQKIVNNGHTVEVIPEGGKPTQLTLDGDVYTLQQFHFHTPSENTLDGKQFPLEGHFVFMHDAQPLVLAVMYEDGAPSKALVPFINQLKNVPHEETPLAQTVDLKALLPQSLHYYRFSGSLTTPPCSEGVIWLVLDHHVKLSLAQLGAFEQAIGLHNNRPVQPLNGRVITD